MKYEISTNQSKAFVWGSLRLKRAIEIFLEVTVYDIWFWIITVYLSYHYLLQLATWIIWKYYPK